MPGCAAPLCDGLINPKASDMLAGSARQHLPWVSLPRSKIADNMLGCADCRSRTQGSCVITKRSRQDVDQVVHVAKELECFGASEALDSVKGVG